MEFFETKVIKVKKEKKRCGHQPAMVILGDKYAKFKCIKCGEIYSSDISSTLWGKREKDNWVNGENLDKIMFPCLCSYKNINLPTHYGMITKTRTDFEKSLYTLHSIEKQNNSYSSVKSYSNLKDLIMNWGIHILKGKILIFEEEK